ncbi:MAG: hypothetical protein OZSIB_2108 [Candidatus Ozemobacter sibiricus]|uniref:Uncharacterized protein n=1 Tax=Candidatus Ozemobacter sibiricus TaxID=2268124 RepID=A0A367ZU51_9BACT|nr:MAG: hypothetical protein OZSIB_2108 [Candidatus Ozemobacter sibiricus]
MGYPVPDEQKAEHGKSGSASQRRSSLEGSGECSPFPLSTGFAGLLSDEPPENASGTVTVPDRMAW